jgi:long-chain acyl-CoA synthetase
LLAALPDTDIFMYYGLTEASRSTYIEYRKHTDKLETVGAATPGTEVCIGQPAQPLIGEPGEVLVRGRHVTAGYWGQDTSAYFDQGWFRTGDLGVMDSAGFVTWLGRVRDQINVNGLKLVPSEVEDILRLDSRVLDCAVVGVPESASGESVIAFVVVAEGAAEPALERILRKLCNEHLEDHKVPRRVHFVAEIPKTDSGKVRRHVLRDSLIQGK